MMGFCTLAVTALPVSASLSVASPSAGQRLAPDSSPTSPGPSVSPPHLTASNGHGVDEAEVTYRGLCLDCATPDHVRELTP